MTAPLYERLVARHPVGKAKGVTDLAALAKAYAKKAGYHGMSGPWWRVWRAIERARGHDLRTAIATLPASDLRWFALWSFARKRSREGIVIYRTYLASPGEIGPFDVDNAIYLRQIIALRGGEAALRAAKELAGKAMSSDLVDGILTELRAQKSSPEELLAHSPEPTGSKVHNGAAWASRAIALARSGDRVGAERALDRSAKLGLRRSEKEIERLLLETLQITASDWEERQRPWAYPKDDLSARWLKNPGSRVVPTRATSAHVYGGDEFALPKCTGCGRPEHQFFVFDVAAISDLRERIPKWKRLPLNGCTDCSVWLVRRDYVVHQDDGRIETIGVSAEGDWLAGLGKAYSKLAPIKKQPVDIIPVGKDEPAGTDRTQIGGEPDWVQDFERAFCPRCWEELAFVAAIGANWSDSKFEPTLDINNASGNQYYFACNDCGVLSVFGQNT